MAQAGAGMGGIGAPAAGAGGGGFAAPPQRAVLGGLGVRPRFDIASALTSGGLPKKTDKSFKIWDKL